jgi:hypothetical protein
MKPFGFSKEFSKLKSLEELSLTDEGYLLDASFLKGKFNQLLELDLSSDTIRNLNFDSCEFPKLKYLNINSQLKMNKVKHLIDLPNIKKIQINSLSASDTLCFKINDSSEVYLWLGEYQEPRDFTVNFCKIHPQHFKNVRFFDETAEIKTNGFFTSDLMVFGGDNNFMKFINLMGRWSDNKKDYILNTKEIILPSTIIIKEDYIKYFNGLNKIKFDFGHGIKKDLESMFNTAKLIRLQNKTVKFELAFLPDFNQMNETLQSNYREYSAKLKQL